MDKLAACRRTVSVNTLTTSCTTALGQEKTTGQCSKVQNSPLCLEVQVFCQHLVLS